MDGWHEPNDARKSEEISASLTGRPTLARLVKRLFYREIESKTLDVGWMRSSFYFEIAFLYSTLDFLLKFASPWSINSIFHKIFRIIKIRSKCYPLISVISNLCIQLLIFTKKNFYFEKFKRLFEIEKKW